MTIGIDSRSFQRARWSLDAILSFISGLGVSCLSLDLRLLPAADRTYLCALREMLRDRGLQPILAWRPRAGLYARELTESLEAAVLVGASILRIIDESPSAADDRADGPAEPLITAAPIAARQGVTMAVENSARRRSADLLDLLSRVGSASVCASFDTRAAREAGEDPAVAAASLGRLIRTVQATDPASIPGVVRELRSCGYTGAVLVCIDDAAPEDKIRESVAYLKELAQAW